MDAPAIMSPEEMDEFEERLQASFPAHDLHILVDLDGKGEVWSGDTPLNVKWTSVDPGQIVGLPLSLNPRSLKEILYDMIFQEVKKLVDRVVESGDSNKGI